MKDNSELLSQVLDQLEARQKVLDGIQNMYLSDGEKRLAEDRTSEGLAMHRRGGSFGRAVWLQTLDQLGLQPETIAAMQPGDKYDYYFPNEDLGTLNVHVELTTPKEASALTQNGYFGAREAGLISAEDTYQSFSERPIVTIYSEVHGGQTFAYDAVTGRRFWPRAPRTPRVPQH